MKFAFILGEKAFPVAFMCRQLEVSKSGFYAWSHRPESALARDDRRLKVSIRAFWKQSRRTYGSHRLHEDLTVDGEKVSRKRVLRLMKEDGVVGCQRRRRFVRTTDSNHVLPIAPNVLDRKFVYVVDDKNVIHSTPITVSAELPHVYVVESGIGEKASKVLESRYQARLLGVGRLGPWILST